MTIIHNSSVTYRANVELSSALNLEQSYGSQGKKPIQVTHVTAFFSDSGHLSVTGYGYWVKKDGTLGVKGTNVYGLKVTDLDPADQQAIIEHIRKRIRATEKAAARLDTMVDLPDGVVFFKDASKDPSLCWWVYLPRSDSWGIVVADDEYSVSVEEQVKSQAAKNEPQSMFVGYEDGLTDLIKRFGVGA